MHFVLESRNYEVRVFAIVRESFAHEVPVLEFLREKIEHKQYAGSARGFKGLFVRYSDKGRKGLTAEMFHEVDSGNGIWEFVKGDLRVFCFHDEGHIILTHGSIKKTQKVAQQDITAAVAIKKKYFKHNGK